MWIADLPPFIPFYLAALLYVFIPERARIVILLLPIWGALNLFYTAEGSVFTLQLLEFNLNLMQVDKLSIMFGYLVPSGGVYCVDLFRYT